MTGNEKGAQEIRFFDHAIVVQFLQEIKRKLRSYSAFTVRMMMSLLNLFQKESSFPETP
jgi:hypothetical protein